MMLPVIKQLQLQGYQVTVLGLTTAGAVLQKAGIKYVGFKHLLPYAQDIQSALEYGRQLVGEASVSAVVPHDESVAYHGLCYLDLCETYGQKEAAKLYKDMGRQAFLPKQLLQRYISLSSPDLVIATNSPRAERAAIEAAGKLCIPALCLVDLFAKQEVSWLGRHGYATKLCVLSKHVKQSLVEAGRDSRDIAVTGNPAFDGLTRVRDKLKQRRSSCRKQTILWASQPEPRLHPFTGAAGNPELPQQIERELMSIAKKHTEWQFVFRFHPSENRSYENLPENVQISDKMEDLQELLVQVDCLITMTSTVGLEAALAGLPIISVDMSVFTEDAPYSAMGLAAGVESLSVLEEQIAYSLEHGGAVANDTLPKVGTAVTKVMEEIEKLLVKPAI